MSNETDPVTQTASPTEPTTTPPATTQPTESAATESKTSLLGGDQTTEPKVEAPTFDAAEINLDALKTFLPKDAELNEALGTEFLGILNGAGSRADMAKGLLELQAKIETQSLEAVQTSWNNTVEGWSKELKTDATIGGEKLDANLAKARTVIETYADDPKALKELFALTGVGNNVHMAKLLVKLADAIPGESKPVTGEPTQTNKSRAQRLFSTPT